MKLYKWNLELYNQPACLYARFLFWGSCYFNSEIYIQYRWYTFRMDMTVLCVETLGSPIVKYKFTFLILSHVQYSCWYPQSVAWICWKLFSPHCLNKYKRETFYNVCMCVCLFLLLDATTVASEETARAYQVERMRLLALMETMTQELEELRSQDRKPDARWVLTCVVADSL